MVVEVDFERLMGDFIRRAEDYLQAPDVFRGMELHDVAARIGVACNAHVADADRLVGIFHDFKRTIPLQDTEKLGTLLQCIKKEVSYAA